MIPNGDDGQRRSRLASIVAVPVFAVFASVSIWRPLLVAIAGALFSWSLFSGIPRAGDVGARFRRALLVVMLFASASALFMPLEPGHGTLRALACIPLVVIAIVVLGNGAYRAPSARKSAASVSLAIVATFVIFDWVVCAGRQTPRALIESAPEIPITTPSAERITVSKNGYSATFDAPPRYTEANWGAWHGGSSGPIPHGLVARETAHPGRYVIQVFRHDEQVDVFIAETDWGQRAYSFAWVGARLASPLPLRLCAGLGLLLALSTIRRSKPPPEETMHTYRESDRTTEAVPPPRQSDSPAIAWIFAAPLLVFRGLAMIFS